MKNVTLASKVKELRSLKGLSQEELATLAQLSLRTIQRIEKSETEPHGDTLKRLSLALNIVPEELTICETPMDKRLLTPFYLSALSFIMFPPLGPLVPLILWRTNSHRLAGHEAGLSRFINFQTGWCILLFFAWITFVMLKILHWQGAGYSLQVFLTLYVLNLIFIGYSVIKQFKLT